jgi:hypothetical protein
LALQQNGGDLDGRVLIAPNTDPTSINMTIPDKAARSGKYLKFNDTTGNPEAGSIAGAFTAAGMNHYNFTGDGTTVNFTLGIEPGGENNTQVYIDGVYQQKDGYNVSGAVVQFSVAPPNLSTIEVMVVQVLPVGTTTASQVSFTQAKSTYGRNVQLKLQETVSVKDFGALGDGVTDDTVSIQAALNSGNKYIVFPEGTYIINTTLTLPTSDIITLSGSVARNCILKTTSAIDIMDVAGSLGNSIQYVTIQNLTFSGNNASAVGLRTRHTEFLKIFNCIFIGDNASTGIYMCENANEQDVKPTISNCNFGNTGFGIRGGDTRVADAIITDNFFLNNIVRCMSFGYLDGGSIARNKLFSDNGPSNGLDGIILGRSIYVVLEDNAFFEMGGVAVRLTSPRRSRILNNQIVGTGDNANGAAISITDYGSGIVTEDIIISGNHISATGGSGVFVYSAASLADNIKIQDNNFYSIGSGSVVYDAISLRNTSNFEVKNNIIDGNSATRYWLYLDAATETVIHNNTHTNCVNADVFRINSPTMRVLDSRRILTNVTATTNITFDDDGIIGGALSASIYINLPPANSCAGKLFTATKSDSSVYSLILDPASSQTIDGAATKNVSTQYQTVSLISDGANWITI